MSALRLRVDPYEQIAPCFTGQKRKRERGATDATNATALYPYTQPPKEVVVKPQKSDKLEDTDIYRCGGVLVITTTPEEAAVKKQRLSRESDRAQIKLYSTFTEKTRIILLMARLDALAKENRYSTQQLESFAYLATACRTATYREWALSTIYEAVKSMRVAEDTTLLMCAENLRLMWEIYVLYAHDLIQKEFKEVQPLPDGYEQRVCSTNMAENYKAAVSKLIDMALEKMGVNASASNELACLYNSVAPQSPSSCSDALDSASSSTTCSSSSTTCSSSSCSSSSDSSENLQDQQHQDGHNAAAIYTAFLLAYLKLWNRLLCVWNDDNGNQNNTEPVRRIIIQKLQVVVAFLQCSDERLLIAVERLK